MALAKNLIILFVFLPLINPADSNCPESFECGRLGTLKFPFTNRKGCGGLFMVENCETGEYPSIQFGGGVTPYTVQDIIATNSLFIVDPLLNEFKKTKSCSGSLRNASLPDQSPFTTFKFGSPLITVFTCHNQSPHEADYFKNYSRTLCSPPSWAMYYRNPETSHHNIPLPPLHPIPSQCSVSHVPMNPTSNQYSPSCDLFDLLSDEYEIVWNVTEECYACHDDGGECRTNYMNQFQCYHYIDKKRVVLIASLASAGGVLVIAGLCSCCAALYSFGQSSLLGLGTAKTGQEQDIELFLKTHEKLAQRRYKYSDLKKITKSFSENLGKGGYGSVYKGKLPDGHFVAVKVLNEWKGNGEEFINEVASISQTSHVNVVTLLGFSFEGSKRGLIYDFMPNGSHEKYIQNNSASSSSSPGCRLGWEKLFEIALGIARGLEYLHQGCNMRILHFDIKPHNILLDKDFSPKISDFGLAKLCPNRSSIVSMMVARGTIGYIAPEVFCSNFGQVSYKSDVYSYGMMVLEIAGEKKIIERGDVDRTSETYFPEYVYKQLELLGDVERDGILDEDGSESAKRKLIIVGLWCIQTHPKDRPSMSKVVEMLEGKIESLQVPPKPYLCSPPRLTLDFSITS